MLRCRDFLIFKYFYFYLLHSVSNCLELTMLSSSPDKVISTCANCGKAESDDNNLKRCLACKMVKYCSRNCQVAHRPTHKKACKLRAAELFDEILFNDPPDGPECPICTLPLPFDADHTQFNTCYGQTLCLGCVHAQIKENIGKCKRREDIMACPFCMAPFTKVEKEFIDQLKKCAERNNAKSMEKLALYYMDGKMGLQKDLAKTMELLQKAGEHGCASSYGWLGSCYNKGVQKDIKKAKHYCELGAIGGDLESRYNLAVAEEHKGNKIRAIKHHLICAKAGFKLSLDEVKLGFQFGCITKDEYAAALRAYQKQHDDRKSAMREEALVYDANPSLYGQCF